MIDWSSAVPVRPSPAPGSGAWPGSVSSSFVNGPAETRNSALWPASTAGAVGTAQVTPCAPARYGVMVTAAVPPASAGVPATARLGSLPDSCRAPVAPGTTLNHASTARTLIATGWPADCGSGSPVTPSVVPGTATWPGSSTCSPVQAPGPTLTAALVPRCGGVA